MKCNPLEPNHKPFWSDTKRNISIADNSATKYHGINEAEKDFSLYRIDKDAIVKEQRRCDYLLVRCEDKHCFFIELKGHHLLDAIDQIGATIEALKYQLSDHVLNARIVLTKTNSPDLNHAKYIRLDKMLKSQGGTIIQKSKLLVETH
jgi:hypothetical protein